MATMARPLLANVFSLFDCIAVLLRTWKNTLRQPLCDSVERYLHYQMGEVLGGRVSDGRQDSGRTGPCVSRNVRLRCGPPPAVLQPPVLLGRLRATSAGRRKEERWAGADAAAAALGPFRRLIIGPVRWKVHGCDVPQRPVALPADPAADAGGLCAVARTAWAGPQRGAPRHGAVGAGPRGGVGAAVLRR